MRNEGKITVKPITIPPIAKGINKVPPIIMPVRLAIRNAGLLGLRLYLHPKKLYLE